MEGHLRRAGRWGAARLAGRLGAGLLGVGLLGAGALAGANLLLSPPTAPADDGLVPVVRVVDGDTIRVRIGSKDVPVRYIGMDTPETVAPRKPVQAFGKEAAARNRDLVQ